MSAPRTVLHSTAREEDARRGWYLRNRDRFVAGLALREAARLRLARPARALDAGCGIGTLCALLTERGLDVTGADADEPSLRLGAASGRLAKAVRAEIGRLPFADASFDLCVCSEVLEHLDDDAAGLCDLARVCRGTLVLTVPAHRALWTESDAALMHRRRYSRGDFLALLQAAGLKPAALGGYGLLPGLGILAFKLISKGKTQAPDGKRPEPLAARFKPPRWLDALFSVLFRADLALSARGLIPWGQGWWAVVRRGGGQQ